MALLKQGASAHSLKYVVTEDFGSRNRADMVNLDCVAGPLREHLRLAPVWPNLELTPQISVIVAGAPPVPPSVAYRFRTLGTDVFEVLTTGGSGLVEIRFNDSMER